MTFSTDRINPLVIKELRQGVRSRVLWGAFGMLLVACLAIALTAYLASLSEVVDLSGEGYFGAFYTCACFIYLFVIPSMAYHSLLREQEGETWPLLTMTGLGARRVIRGKIASSLVIAGLYTAVVFPFLLFAYFLNGIELTAILLGVAIALAGMVFLTAVSVCWATFGRNRVLRGVLRTMLILGTLQTAGGVASLWFGWIQKGHAWERETWLIAVIGVWFMASTAYLSYETAVARLSLESEDCAQGPRRALLIQLVGAWAIAVWGWTESGREAPPIMALSIAFSAYLALAGTYLASDRDGVPRGLAGKLRSWNLFLPGAVRGFRLTIWLLVSSVAIAAALQSVSPGSQPSWMRGLHAAIAAGAYAAGYLSAALLIGHRLSVGPITPHLRARIAFAILTFVGSLFPTIVDVTMRKLAPWPGLLSPVAGIGHFLDGDYKSWTTYALASVGAFAASLTLLADRVLARVAAEAER